MSEQACNAVVYAVDESYALPAAVSGRSLQDNLSDCVRLAWYVLDLGLSPEAKDLIVRSWPSVHEIEFVPIQQEALRNLPSTATEGFLFPAAVFGYLLAPELLGKRHRRMVCLDADTLVIQDIGPLFDLQLDGHPFGAARDWPFLGAPLQSFGKKHSPEIQLNSGVLLIDSASWCEQDVTNQVFNFASEHADELMLPDQDSLNVAMRGQWREIGYEWNFQVARTVVREYQGPLPKVLHFGGSRKPWLGRSSLPHYLRLYRAYARRTAFECDALQDEPAYPSYREDDG
jgi:lipopolysaccharide biosynthesis glycosyltransferase